MKLYMVEKNGIYIQGIIGIYDSFEKAESAAKVAKENEPDNYHGFTIYESYLNGNLFTPVYKIKGDVYD